VRSLLNAPFLNSKSDSFLRGISLLEEQTLPLFWLSLAFLTGLVLGNTWNKMGGGKVYLKSLAAVSAADEQFQNNGHSSQFAPAALCRMGSGSNYDCRVYRDVCDYV
jgi:hypothetical protein